ncbi:MAG: type VI secretion system contractile sheath large subunit [Planctomycetes bacterium]|nr:type VI secretion system contractile sheath large subunit [Planctomycetota bacterium]
MADKVQGFTGDFGFGKSDLPDLKAMPLRIMAVGNFCAANRSAAREPAVIDAHDFDKRLSDFMPRALFEVENHLGTGKTIEIDFSPSSIKDFEPRHIAARIKALAPVADFVRRARGLVDGSLKPNDFKRDLADIQAVPALREPLEMVFDKIGGTTHAAGGEKSNKDSVDSAIDSIFGMVDSKRPDTGASAIDSFAAGLGGGQKGIDVGAAIAAAEKLLEKQLAPVLTHESVQALERNWRGLHLLCKRGKGARIEVYDGDFDAWQESVYSAESAGSNDAPLAMLLLADEVSNTPAGLEALQQWGDAGQSLQCVVVFEAGEDFLGVDMTVLAGMDAPANHFEGKAFEKWRSLRDKDESRWLAAALNPYIARPAYTRGKHGADMPALWGSPVWLVGATVAQSMETTGWPGSHTGAAHGEVTGLPVHAHGIGDEYPLRALLSDRHLKDLNKSGFTPLMCQPNNDSAWVLLAPTVHRPSKAEEEGKLGTVAYQLVAARIGEAIVRAKQRLSVPNDVDATVSNIEKYVGALLSDTGAGASVLARVNGSTLEIALRTGRDVLNGIELQLGLGL